MCIRDSYEQTKQDGIQYPVSFQEKVSPFDLQGLAGWERVKV